MMHAESTIFRFTVGRFDCLCIRDGDDWDRNVLLVDTHEHRVLIDTGNGDATSPPGMLLDRLHSAGMAPAEIDIVILSHADVDHVAGAVDTHGTPAFPNARYILAREEWAFWISNAPRFPARDHAYKMLGAELFHLAETVTYERLPQLHGQIELVEFDTEIVPGIRAIAAPGHTPGMIAIAIDSGSDRLLFIADIYYGWNASEDPDDGPKVIGDPAWHTAVDVDPAQALMSRDRLFTQAAREQTLLLASHVRFPGLGYVEQRGTGWQWRPR